jgi:hypothetical protein
LILSVKVMLLQHFLQDTQSCRHSMVCKSRRLGTNGLSDALLENSRLSRQTISCYNFPNIGPCGAFMAAMTSLVLHLFFARSNRRAMQYWMRANIPSSLLAGRAPHNSFLRRT